MNQETWQQAKQIFYEALELSPAERDAFVKKACSGNDDLLEQVKILLESYESGFLEDAVVPDVTNVLVESQIKTGQQIGRYKIQLVLGTGGMGEVYLAEDTELRRLVAVKMLHSEVAEDKERVSRFIQEARAASALNHPNILTIYDIGKLEESRFIVSEFVKGETLRSRLKRENLDLPKSLDIAAQVATALQAAHEAGIVHRDIKPENIIVRNDGLVKVLDFGLAKLTEIKSDSLDSEASTLAEVRTNPGVVMGTVAYMSPEQARGIEIDARTDLWSLGVVLYEMLSGKLPFTGETTSDIIASILRAEVEPFEHLKIEIPHEIEEICFKALAKDPIERYQTVQELLQDLRRVKKHLERVGEQPTVEHFNYADEQKTELIHHRPTSSREYIVRKVKQHKVGSSVFLVVLILTLGVGVGSYWLLSTKTNNNVSNQNVNPLQSMQITRLTNTGGQEMTAISPDGKYTAYIAELSDGKQSLMLKQTLGSSSRELISADNVLYQGLTFSPDGEFIYYSSKNPKTGFSFDRVPVLGGEPLHLLDKVRIVGKVSFAPDGDRFAYAEFDVDYHLKTASIKEVMERRNQPVTIASRHYPEFLLEPAWSPDGSLIACININIDKGSKIVSFTPDGEEKPILTQLNLKEISSLEWLKKSGEFLITALSSSNNGRHQIWRITKDGDARQITNDLSNYGSLSVSVDETLLVAAQSLPQSHIYVGSVSGNKQKLFFGDKDFKQITNGVNVINREPIWTPDGKIIYASLEEGRESIQIFQINPDSSGNKQLTHVEKLNGKHFTITPDGRFVLFSRKGQEEGAETEVDRIWRLNLQDGSLSQLTFDKPLNGENCPSVTPDSQSLIYNHGTGEGGRCILRKMSLATREIIDLTDSSYSSCAASLSPDGKHVVFEYLDNKSEGNKWLLAVVSLSNTKVAPKIFFNESNGSGVLPNWTPDSRAFVYVHLENGKQNLRAVPIDGTPPYNITNFSDDMDIVNFDFNLGGNQLVVARGKFTSDIVLIKNFN